jgi:hypothetical protein
MLLSAKVSGEFDSAVRSRGQLYAVGGTVRITRGDQRAVQANVRGTRMYHIEIVFDDGTLKVSCGCPYYESTGPCKHIWATLLAAENKGYLRAAGSYGAVDLVLADEADDDQWDEEDDYFEEKPVIRPAVRLKPAAVKPPERKKTAPAAALPWKKILSGVARFSADEDHSHTESWPSKREILYLIDVPATLAGAGLILEVAYRELKKGGTWSKTKTRRIPVSQIARLPDPADRQIMALLVGAKEHYDWSGPAYYYGYDTAPLRYKISAPMAQTLMPLICETGRCRLRRSPEDEGLPVVRWDDAGPWDLWLEVGRDETGKNYRIRGALRRDGARMDLLEPVMFLKDGLLFTHDQVGRFNDFGAFGWVYQLRQHGEMLVPVASGIELLEELLRLPHLPRLELPAELRFEEIVERPRPCLKVKAPEKHPWGGAGRLRAELSFDYGGVVIGRHEARRGAFQAEKRLMILRDAEAEQAAFDQLLELGFRQPSPSYYDRRPGLELAPPKLPRVVSTLVQRGWHVEAEGKLYRRPGAFNIEVKSGIDWFELHGTVEFGDTVARLPELLAALRRGENVVRLGDGTFGLLPEEWLQKYGAIAGLGAAAGDHLRFTRSQVGFLDALLAAQPAATCDAAFARAREELRKFDGIKPADPPAGFVGTLRGYQRDGLGWLHFLQRFGFGGCLADDMGLGKTVQVLALLESRRELRSARNGPAAARNRMKRAPGVKNPGKPSGDQTNELARPAPSLVVVPKSLVFNWRQEAARFAPQLRVLDHTGAVRTRTKDRFDEYDVVITTYGTLRRDAAHFKDVQFDYVILDEAQAIKNANTESAKAVRLLRGTHRLALSGTPVENHLGELWSLFEFLNPGMLGAASVFQLSGASARNPDEATRALLARALRPFILRRTKEQVAKELPPRLEQTLYCELEPAQRRQYNELRDHYRDTLLRRIEREGIARAKIQILEALLRLRQAACHPGLIDKKRVHEPSAKLEMLLPQLAEVLEEGHKALVFSQFTSLLAIVRDRLDREGTRYEYLDGRTRDRAARVEKFQTDPDCKLFLISLKAGGLGLNLTAAEYVFLLDPWWNPAVEAQAIDRAHRIGQTARVFAYRLIARDTVEEKVLKLQGTKRQLADAIIGADNNLIRNLGREDLELLLS